MNYLVSVFKPIKTALIITSIASLSLVTACAEKKPATDEEKWVGYCTSIGHAARTIALDRQNGITEKEAYEYANKITDPTTKKFVLEQVQAIYAYPKDQLKSGKDEIRVQFMNDAREKCINTPHDPKQMPDYKPF